MNRRAFCLLSVSALALPHTAMAYSSVTFRADEWSELRKSDQTLVLNFRAKWSLTCQIKLEMIAKLIAENPGYGQLTFVDIDWDTFGQSQMTQRMKVTRRSTLVVMKGGQEIARIVNEPYERKMRAFLDQALAA